MGEREYVYFLVICESFGGEKSGGENGDDEDEIWFIHP